MDEFKTKFRNVEILILDDVQFYCRQGENRGEFFHPSSLLHELTYNIVYQHQINSHKFWLEDYCAIDSNGDLGPHIQPLQCGNESRDLTKKGLRLAVEVTP